MRITATQRTTNENRIRTVIDRLLRGDIPPSGRCDVTTLAREAGVDRTALYGNRPYAYLRAEFEHRLHALHQAGERPDPRDAQIARLNDEVAALKHRLARSISANDELTDFRAQSLARLAAQHDEISRLRGSLATSSHVTRLPRAAAIIGPCS